MVTTKSFDYSDQELMAVILARDLQDGEVGMAGPASHIPVAACLLAQQMHAPNLTFILPGPVNPHPERLYWSTFDFRYLKGAEAIINFRDLFEASEQGVDFMFYSGIQIDKYGNINQAYVGGDAKKPMIKGPGLANVPFAITSKRYYLFPTHHTKRNLVDRVDFVSGVGNLGGPRGTRKDLGISTLGPKLCVTPLALFEFPANHPVMTLKSIHEGVTIEAVIKNTGFEIKISGEVSVTPPPTKEELEILRKKIDRSGLLRNKA